MDALHGLCRDQRWEEADALLTSLPQQVAIDTIFHDGPIGYSAMHWACAHSGSAALELAKRMAALIKFDSKKRRFPIVTSSSHGQTHGLKGRSLLHDANYVPTIV